MGLKIGNISFIVVWDGRKVEYWEYILRTIQVRNGIRWGYWWPKLPGITWGKVSTKHFDYGWLPDAPAEFRVKRAIDRGRPFAASKEGALRDEIADLRRQIESYGPDEIDDMESGATLGDRLKAATFAQDRMRAKGKPKP